MTLNFRGWEQDIALSCCRSGRCCFRGSGTGGRCVRYRLMAAFPARIIRPLLFDSAPIRPRRLDGFRHSFLMRFEPNQGQTDPQVNFLARGAGYGLFLTPDQAVLTLALMLGSRTAIVRMQLAGANPAAAVTGPSRFPGKSNYFIGNDPAKWHRDIPQFARVRYQAVYPGVDLVYYGNQGQLEYDFEVAPGADPNAIAFQFDSSQRPRLDDDGDLILAADSGEVRLKAPRIYQGNGVEQKPVAGRFNRKTRWPGGL